MKRFFDFVSSLCGILILLPLFVILAFAVVIDTGFPVFFLQKRVGLYGRPFFIYKFRTMTLLKDASQGSFDAGDSRRVTPVGRVLRRTKLDELPQLWNVLRGDMSLVGPRPEVQKWVDVYPERWSRVLSLRPGITDNASLEFRNEEELLAASSNPEKTYSDEVLPRKLDLYEDYVQNHSLAGDIRIIFRTIFG
ncbi:MAG: sugar transferase [Bacteroidales bacterium]|jgi:lipopolysaccharide/colanic/teichoic acid biosynthesis glycosyltransferase|nr:sugar transferase [Bacteroidales bacterium]